METADAGDRVVILEESLDNQVGDRIIIASTGDRLSWNENEEHEVTSVRIICLFSHSLSLPTTFPSPPCPPLSQSPSPSLPYSLPFSLSP